ncbi:type II toxin-antitoxin system MqsA family antitoxin [Arhodomonas sp. SL1]|uniref:type II toxin-antitoxin system MqsA family antitoxin n=1 Tax=Arhodomonas sp. SL1 TaxID=3425691 RepID=UPI003F8806A1
MSQSNANERRVCPACGEGRLEPVEGSQRVEHAGVHGTLPLHYAVCSVCGSEIAREAEARANKRAMIAFRKRAEGLLTGAEMRQARRAMGLTQAQAAELFGGGKVGFSRYENDDIAQSEAMDSLVRICLEQPENLIRLAALKEVRLGAVLPQRRPVDEFAYDRISAIKRTLEHQIRPERVTGGPVSPHPKVVDIQRWRKAVA